MQEKIEKITNHILQFWTKILENGHCGSARKESILLKIKSSERPKPLLWFRSNTKTETQNGFRTDTVNSQNHISKGEI